MKKNNFFFKYLKDEDAAGAGVERLDARSADKDLRTQSGSKDQA